MSRRRRRLGGAGLGAGGIGGIPGPPVPVAIPLSGNIISHLFKDGATIYDGVSPNQVVDNSALAVGTARAIHQGHALLYDGVNDHDLIPDWNVGAGESFRFVFSYDFTGNAVTSFYTMGRELTSAHFQWREAPTSSRININGVNTSFSWGSVTGPQSRSGTFDISYPGSGNATMTWTSFDPTVAPRVVVIALTSAAFMWRYLARGNINNFMQGKMWGVKLYRLGVLERYYPMEEGSGTISYDASGNAQHGTYTGGPTHVTQDVYSSRNELGYTLSGAVYIPRNEASPTLDAAGGAIQFTNRVPYNALLKDSNCVYMNGTGFWSVPHLLGGSGVTVTSSGGTAVPTVDHALGRITFTAGTVWDLLLSDGTRFPCAEGAGDLLFDVGANGVLIVDPAAAGRKIVAGDISGGTRYGRIMSNSFTLAGATVDIVGDAGTFTITAGGPFDTAKIFDGTFFDVTGATDTYVSRKYRVKSVTASVITIWDRSKRDLTGETLSFIFDESRGRKQQSFHWNLKNGFSQVGQVKRPARADGSLTDACCGLPLLNPPGAYHNMAETRLDLTGGVASPPAVKYAWETDYGFQQDILPGNEEAWCRAAPNYSNQCHSMRESDFITYPSVLGLTDQASLFAISESRWGQSWNVNDHGTPFYYDLATLLTANQQANIDDCTAVLAPLFANSGPKKHVILWSSVGKVDMKFGRNDGLAEVPLLIGSRTKITALPGIRFNEYGVPLSLSLIHEQSIPSTDIALTNLLVVMRGTVVNPSGNFVRQEAISLEGCDGVVLLSNKIRGWKYYNTGFALRTRSCINGTEYFSQIRAGGGNGSDARHFNDSSQGFHAFDGFYLGGDDAFSITEESVGTFVSEFITATRCFLASKNNSAGKGTIAASANLAGSRISDCDFDFCTMGCWTGGTGTIVQPPSAPGPSQPYDAANGISWQRVDNDGSATVKLCTIERIRFRGCAIDGQNGNARTANLANLAAGAVEFSQGTMITNCLSWGLHVQNGNDCIDGTVKTRFDETLFLAGTNAPIHLGSSSFNSNFIDLNGTVSMNHNRATQAVSINRGNSNKVRYGLFIDLISKAIGIQGAAASDSNEITSNSARNISAAGILTNNGQNTIDDGLNSLI